MKVKPSGRSNDRSAGIGPEIIEHWFTLVPWQSFSSREFYAEIQAEIEAKKVPALDIKRVELPEGGLLSDNREYLRMKRERLSFDVCAAPVGADYFFSYRYYVEPVEVKPWHLAAILFALYLLLYVSIRYVGIFLGPTVLASCLVLGMWTMRNAIGLGLRDLDSSLIKTPIVGPVYERFFRKDTYYRQDLRIAYGSIVSAIVKQKVEAITGAKGVRLLREFSYNPLFGDLYNVRSVEPSPEAGAT